MKTKTQYATHKRLNRQRIGLRDIDPIWNRISFVALDRCCAAGHNNLPLEEHDTSFGNFGRGEKLKKVINEHIIS